MSTPDPSRNPIHRAVPNIPPVGLREPENCCLVCDRALPDAADRHPLRLEMTLGAKPLPALVIAFACKPCRLTRHEEVRRAHFEAAGKYVHVPRIGPSEA